MLSKKLWLVSSYTFDFVEAVNKNFLKKIIWVIGFSMFGIVIIQFYWLSNAVDLNKESFDRQVGLSLEKVVDHLEKKETIEKLKSHRQGKFLFFKSDSTSFFDENMADKDFEYFIIKDLQQSGDDIEIKVVEEQKGKNMTETSIKRVSKEDLIRQSSSDEKITSLNYQSGFMGDNITIEESARTDSTLKDRFANKRAYVGDIVKSLMEVDINAPLEERIDPLYLDSIIKKSLKEHGITTKYEFGVFTARNQMLMTNCNQASTELSLSDYSIELFPHDIIQDPNFLKLNFPRLNSFIFQNLAWLWGLSLVFLGLISYAFFYTINTILRQKKLSEVKADFVNNMTHELKTPISTISLACEALNDPVIGSNEKLYSRYLKMITDENNRLKTQVERVLQNAIWETGSFQLEKNEIQLNELIKNVSENIEIQISDKGGEIQLELEAKPDIVIADEIHISNVLYNLLDNANKYAKEAPKIKIRSYNEGAGVTFEVCDNGVGISKENQKKVFEKLYRVPTGNLHDVSGFGIGLSYVNTVVNKHGGWIKLKSQLNKGSTFIIHLPYNYD